MAETIPFEERLKQFGQQTSETEGPWGLKNLLRQMTVDNVNPRILDGIVVDEGSNNPSVVQSVLKGQFVLDPFRRTTDRVFTGEATVVALDYRARFVWFFENANGHVHEEHGEKYGDSKQKTLLPFAIRKAARRLHLESLPEFYGGIVEPFNFQYLSEIGPENIGVFAGDASDPFVIGVSGAQATEKFLAYLMGKSVEQHTTSMLAGIMDTVLAEGIVQRLRNPNLKAYSIKDSILQIAHWH